MIKKQIPLAFGGICFFYKNCDLTGKIRYLIGERAGSLSVHFAGEVTLARIGEKSDYGLPLVFGAGCCEKSCKKGSARGDSRKDTLASRKGSSRVIRFLFADGDDLVDDACIKRVGDKARADTLKSVRTCLAL